MSALVTDAGKASEKAISQHKKHLGRNEYPAGSNRTAFGKAYGWDGVFYCAQAVGVTDCVWGYSDWYASMNKSASSSAIYNWHKRVGRTVSVRKASRLQRGDLIHLFLNGKSVHIERVLSHKGGKLICIGSNTSNAGGGSTANGGGTYINDRTAWWNNRGSNRGYSIKHVSRPLYGVTNEAIRLCQKAAGITVDGKYGPNTKKAIQAIQKAGGLTQDGFPGPKTMALVTGKQIVAKVTKPATSVKPAAGQVKVTGKYDRQTHSEIQRRMGWKVDGRMGPNDLAAMCEFLGLPAYDEISGQPRTAAEFGNAINPKIWDHDPGHKGDNSKFIRRLEAYALAEVDRGSAGSGLATRIQKMLNAHKGFFKPSDKPIAAQRAKKAGV